MFAMKSFVIAYFNIAAVLGIGGIDMCYEDEFFQPYVKVVKNRNDPEAVKEIHKSGFMDLSYFTSMTLCVNGPAILYYDVDEMPKYRRRMYLDMISSDEEDVVKSSESIKTSEDTYNMQMGEIAAAQELINEHEKDSSPDTVVQMLEDVAHFTNAIKADIGENNPSSKLVSEILQDIEHTKEAVENESGPTVDTLNNVIREAQGALESINANKATHTSPSSTILKNILEEVEEAVTSMQVCSAQKSSEDCHTSPKTVLQTISKKIVVARDSLENDEKHGTKKSYIQLLDKILTELSSETTNSFPSPVTATQTTQSILELIESTSEEEMKSDNVLSSNKEEKQKRETVSDEKSEEHDITNAEITNAEITNAEEIIARIPKNNKLLARAAHRMQRSVADTESTLKYDKYKKGKLSVYKHQCIKINRITKAETIARRNDPVRAKQPVSRSTDMLTQRVYGIYLLGQKEDYRKPAVYQFLDPEFAHVVDGISESLGNSFVAIGQSNDWCCKSAGKDLTLIHNSGSEGELCTYGGGHPEYDNLFPIGTQLTDFEWKQCNKGDPELELTTNKPVTKYENFSSIDFAPKNKPSQSKHDDIPAFIDESVLGNLTSYFLDSTTPTSHNYTATTTARPLLYSPPRCKGGFLTYAKMCKIQLSSCQKLPTYNPNYCIDNPSSGIDKCNYLDVVLNLTELDENGTIVDENEIDGAIEWKVEIIKDIVSIYNKICYRVNPQMAPAVGRVIMHYLNKAYKAKPGNSCLKSENWEFLRSELKLCSDCAEEMLIFWTDDEGKRRTRNIVEFDESSDEADEPIRRTYERHEQTEPIEEPPDPDHFIYPENVTVLVGDSDNTDDWDTEIPIFYYEDAAERDFELSIPVDLQFKVFTTVCGYCNLHYAERKSETFPRLYSTFYEDFINPLEDIWLRPWDNEIMKHLFNEYTDPAVMRWIDTCVEAAYVMSNSSTFRPPRPLIIPEGDTDVANYFLDEPPFIMERNRNMQTTTPSPELVK